MTSQVINNSEPKAKRPLEDDETAVVAASATTEAPKKKKKKKQKAAKPSEDEVAARAAFEAKWYADQEKYLWFKAECDPAQTGGHSHYFFHKKTRETSTTEPGECYWIYDPETNNVNVSAGLQYPDHLNAEASVQAKASPSATGEATGSVISADVAPSETPALTAAETADTLTQDVPNPAAPVDILSTIPRYDPKIHGDYDESQPYAERYRILREREEQANRYGIGLFTDGITRDQQDAAVASFDHHESMIRAENNAPDGTAKVYFNRNTGILQTADQGPSRHSDDAKSYRQLSAYFDVEAAASSNNGVSLKDERRKLRYSKEEIKQFKLKREEKKRKKLLAWARS